MPPSETNLLRFSLTVLYTNFELFGNKRKEQSDVQQVIDPPWTKFLATPQTAWVRLNHLHTGVGRFCPVCTNGVWPLLQLVSVAQEIKPLTIVVFQCPIHRPSHGLHGLTVLDDETIEWLLYTCPEISCGKAVHWKNWLKRWWCSSLCLHTV